MAGKVEPPVFISAGKRLNFTRRNEWSDELQEWFSGSGKETGCSPEASWEELCALATAIVRHPAYVEVTSLPGPYQPTIEDADGEKLGGGERG